MCPTEAATQLRTRLRKIPECTAEFFKYFTNLVTILVIKMPAQETDTFYFAILFVSSSIKY